MGAAEVVAKENRPLHEAPLQLELRGAEESGGGSSGGWWQRER